MTLCDGTSSTVSIMLMRAPMRSTTGTISARPGSRVRTYRPKRSTVHSCPWGTDLTAIRTKMKAKTTTTRTKTEKALNIDLFHPQLLFDTLPVANCETVITQPHRFLQMIGDRFSQHCTFFR